MRYSSARRYQDQSIINGDSTIGRNRRRHEEDPLRDDEIIVIIEEGEPRREHRNGGREKDRDKGIDPRLGSDSGGRGVR